MRLSKRLELVASFVPEGSSLADIGTDHGYVPIWLAQKGVIENAVAMDVREGPLQRARAHIMEAGLENRIQTRLSDGLTSLRPGEADCAVIAGMGGELILHILKEGRFLWDSIRCFVLSPQSELDKVRRYLEEQGFFIFREAMIKEEGKYYTVMAAARDGRHMNYEKDIYYTYGRLLIEEKNQVLREYLKNEEGKLLQIQKELKDKTKDSAVRRKEELEEALRQNKEAQHEMQ
ncbi:MAG TPA: class I SAM-dependent methyltransferase [Candidatus Hungatella pullicola]|nr:class I SAM-dependent methyltransferase [Candidatus Hungatella pullicola]